MFRTLVVGHYFNWKKHYARPTINQILYYLFLCIRKIYCCIYNITSLTCIISCTIVNTYSQLENSKTTKYIIFTFSLKQSSTLMFYSQFRGLSARLSSHFMLYFLSFTHEIIRCYLMLKTGGSAKQCIGIY